MRTLTDGSLHNHSIRVGRVLAVSSSIDSLDFKNIVCTVGQAMAHKPETQVSLMLLEQALQFRLLKIQDLRLNLLSFRCNIKTDKV